MTVPPQPPHGSPDDPRFAAQPPRPSTPPAGGGRPEDHSRFAPPAGAQSGHDPRCGQAPQTHPQQQAHPAQHGSAQPTHGQPHAPTGGEPASAPAHGSVHPQTAGQPSGIAAGALELTREDARLRERLTSLRGEVARVVVGQDEAVEGILIGLLVQGHVLLEGVPGVAKTLLVRTISAALDLEAHRVQFTPDLMPGDVTGSMVYDAKSGDFEFRRGPVFANLLIADEINRTPPKTQSALLESMEERQVSVDGTTMALPDPFLVAATQNPVEQEGTYPLPEAQLDRFLFKLVLDLPDRDAEFAILTRHAEGFSARRIEDTGISRVAGAEDLLAAGRRVARVHCAPEVISYIVDIVQATRQAPSLQLGVSPRGATRLLAAAQAKAWLAGRGFVTPDDVKFLIPQTFRHRISLRPDAEMEGVSVEQVLTSIVDSTPVPR